MSRHDVVWVRPAPQRLHSLAPCTDRGVVFADVETEFLRRVIEISCERYIRHGRPVAEEEVAAFETLVDDAEVAVDAALEEVQHRGIAGRLGKVFQETVRPEKAVDLLIV